MAMTKTELLAACDNYFGSREKTESWLKTEILALGNKTPGSLLVTQPGIDQVYNLIVRLEHGMTA